MKLKSKLAFARLAVVTVFAAALIAGGYLTLVTATAAPAYARTCYPIGGDGGPIVCKP